MPPEISLTAQAPPDISVFDTPVTFGSTELKTRISLDEYGEVAGLFILTADAL